MHSAIFAVTPRAPALAPRHADAALQVLADGSLFQSIVRFVPGIPFFALRVKRQLKCTQPEAAVLSYFCDAKEVPPEDIALWKNAVLAGDKRTLEALHVLASLESDVGRQVRAVLRGVFDFVVGQATETRDTSLLDWIRASGLFPFDRECRGAMFQLGERGDVQMLRRLHEHGCYINFNAVNGAAANGHLDVLQYIQSLGQKNARSDGSAIQFAAANGHLHVLEFLLQHQTEWGFRRWASQAFSRAVESGQLHVVQYLHENGFECQGHAMDGAAANGHLDIVKYMHENQIGNKGGSALTSALTNGHLEVAKFLVATGRTCLIGYIDNLVKNDELETLQILCARGSDYDIEVALEIALKHRNLNFAKFLYALNPGACARQGNYKSLTAAENGFLEFIEFFHESGDPKFFDYRAMQAAVENGHLDIVKFLHENRDEPFYISTLETAFKRGHHQVVDYLCENRPTENPRLGGFWGQYDDIEELTEKIERGVAAARAAGRRLYYY